MYSYLELGIFIFSMLSIVLAIISTILWGVYLLIRKLPWSNIWKKVSKISTMITVIILLVVFLFHFVYFFGWRMFGYSACKLTSSLSVIAVDQNEDELYFTLSGFYKTQYPTGDYICEINDNVLTIGFHTQSRLIFPHFNVLEQAYVEHGPVASINVSPGDISNINRIYVKSGTSNDYYFVKENGEWIPTKGE